MNELVEKWKDKLKKGESARKRWRETFRVDDLDKYYEGFQQPSWWNEVSFVPINLIFANMITKLDSLKAITPKFNVRPSRALGLSPQIVQNLDMQAKLRENILNYTVREHNFRRELLKTRLDGFVSYGVVKTIYEPYHRSNPNAGKSIKKFSGGDALNSDNSQMIEPDTLLSNELFTISRRNPADILLDPLADSIENITWVAERIEFTLEEVKSNKLFKNTKDIKAFEIRVEEKENEKDRKVGKDAGSVLTGPHSSQVSMVSKSPEDEIVYIWEIYDITNNRLISIAEGHDEILRDDPMPLGIEKHPYVFMWFYDRRNSPYPIPEIWSQIGPQDEYNITRNQIMLHRKRFNRKYTVREGAIDDSELAKLEEPYDGIVIKVKQDGDVIKAITDPGLDQAVYFDVEMLRKDFMDISGSGVPEGEMAKIEKATVANIVAGRQQSRQMGNTADVAAFLNEVARKLMLLIENELTIPFAISVNGPIGSSWVNLNPDALGGGLGEFNYEISVSSLIPRDPDSERTAWIAFSQFIAMNPIIMQNPVFITKTAQMFGVEDAILVVEVQQVAQAIQQQQMMQGGQVGQPSMSPDMQKVMNGG